MNRSRLISIISIALFIALASIACEGPTGPEGPQGPQGPEGPQGPPGTANVIYSDWIGFDSSNWSEAYSNFGQTRRDYPVEVPEIDEEILSMGTVKVYARIPSVLGDKVFPLSWIYGLTKGIAQVLSFELEPGMIIINFHDLVDDSADPGTFGDVVEYRYVIIPGGVPAKMGDDFLKDYSAVKEYYGLPN